MSVLLLLLACYLIGAVPTGLLLGRWIAGVDIREHGSRNIGFTNALRVCGPKVGVPVLAIDIAKAWVAVALLPGWLGAADWPVAAGIAVMVGNLFNLFLGGKGGKGVASGFGVFLGLVPGAALAALVAFLLAYGATRVVSVGSIAAAVVLPLAAGATHGIGSATLFAAAAAVFVIVKHRANIERLLRGEEPPTGPGSGRHPSGLR